jgi:hypothetical protein
MDYGLNFAINCYFDIGLMDTMVALEIDNFFEDLERQEWEEFLIAWEHECFIHDLVKRARARARRKALFNMRIFLAHIK